MGHELADLLEGTFVEQEVHALAGGEFAFLVLGVHPFGSTALQGLGDPGIKGVEMFLHGVLVYRAPRAGQGGQS
jgi:hypothetical protein